MKTTTTNLCRLLLILPCFAATLSAADDAAITEARTSSEIAGYSLSKVQRWLHEVR